MFSTFKSTKVGNTNTLLKVTVKDFWTKFKRYLLKDREMRKFE